MMSEGRRAIEHAALDVLVNLDSYRLPVDPRQLASEERILLAPGSYDGCFDGRIEFRKHINKFIIFFSSDESGLNAGRVNFSLGHELGHFYLEEHRGYLTSGIWHGSHAGFISDNRLEREADWFAAALLMPEKLFRREIDRFGWKFCTLRNLKVLSNRLKVSLTATAIRYCECDIEATSVILSRQGRIIYHVPSWEMRRFGFGSLPRLMPIPLASHTGRLLADPIGTGGSVDDEIYAGVWFNKGWGKLWEEAEILGDTGLTLTYLSRENATH